MRSLGLAAHPEGSPDIGADAFADASMGAPTKQNCVTRCPLALALREKNAYAGTR